MCDLVRVEEVISPSPSPNRFTLERNQFEAAREGDLDQLRVALTLGNVDSVFGGSRTALHFAAWFGHFECVKLCLEMRANVNALSSIGHTPLYCASTKGHANIARLLLDAGANVHIADIDGLTPLYRALYHKHLDIARLLIDRGAMTSNVNVNPNWVTSFSASRSKCRSVAVIIIAIHKFHQTNITGNNDINVLRLIGKHIWSTRMDGAWSKSKTKKAH
jgi:ankyrin repeat protein